LLSVKRSARNHELNVPDIEGQIWQAFTVNAVRARRESGAGLTACSRWLADGKDERPFAEMPKRVIMSSETWAEAEIASIQTGALTMPPRPNF